MLNACKPRVTPAEVIGNRENWTLGREKGDETEK